MKSRIQNFQGIIQCYIIQSFNTGIVKKVLRQEFYEVPALQITMTTKSVVSELEEHFFKSGNELFDAEIETDLIIIISIYILQTKLLG